MTELPKALSAFLGALEVNEQDSLGSLSSDDQVLFTLSGSWSRPVSVTLGDLRGIRDVATLLRSQHAEIERLRADVERGRFLLDLMEAHGLLSVEFCRPEAGQTETGDWWVLFPPYGADRMRAPLGFAKTPEGAIDAARKAKG